MPISLFVSLENFALLLIFYFLFNCMKSRKGVGRGVKMEHAGNSYGLMDISVAREAWWH